MEGADRVSTDVEDGSRPRPSSQRHVPRTPPGVEEAKRRGRVLGRELRLLLARTIRRHLPTLPERTGSPPELPRAVGAHARLLPVIRLFPWLLGVVFASSFLWDLPDVVLTVAGRALELEGLLRIVSVSGLIGFFTNWLAITMLFHPRRRRPVFGQGLIPAQRERVIFRLAKAVSEELINEEIIKAKIEESRIIPKYRDVALAVTRGVVEDPDFRRDLKRLTAEYLDSVLSSDEVRRRIVDFTSARLEDLAGRGLGGLALRAYRYVNEKDFQRRVEQAVRELPGSLDVALDEIDHVLDRLPEKIEARSADMEAWVTRLVLGFVENLDVYGIVVENMERYDEQKLEALIKSTSNEQLNYIKYLGAVLGCAGGLVIWRPLLALALFAIVGGTLYAIDELVFRGWTGAPNRENN